MNDFLTKEFESIKGDLIKKYDELGMRASGSFEEGLEVVTTQNKVTLLGYDYSEQLEKGREPGGYPPQDAIQQWIIDKGIMANVEGEITINQLAFLIARKIARDGWDRRDYGGVELISQVITTERIDAIIKKVGESEAVKFSSQIIELIKELQ